MYKYTTTHSVSKINTQVLEAPIEKVLIGTCLEELGNALDDITTEIDPQNPNLPFLNYPEGIYVSSLCDYRDELYEICSHISTRGLREDMVRRINEITNTLNDQVSVKISRLKRAFTDAVGVSLADHYIIQGENAERKK